MAINSSHLNRSMEVLILIFPAMFILVPKGGDIVGLIMLAVSLTYLAVNRSTRVSYSVEEKKLLAVIGLYFGLYMLNNFLVGSKALETDGISLFIILLPVFYHIRKISVNRKFVIYGILAGAFACLLIAVYQKYVFGTPRVSGFFKIHSFGAISIILALMCLWMALLTQCRKMSLIMYCGFGSGLSASLLSGSRGAWLSVFSCLALMIVVNPKAWPVRKRVIITLFSVVLISSTYALPNVQQRVELAATQFDAYFSQGVVKNSIGLRLEVWRAALISIGERPWLGVGSENYDDTIVELANRGKIDPVLITSINHVHNEYLSAGLYRGIPGLVSLLLIFLVPLYLFIKYYHSVKGDDQLLVGCGIMMIVSGMTTSMTSPFFQHHRESLFFVVYILFIYGLVFSRGKSVSTKTALPSSDL